MTVVFMMIYLNIQSSDHGTTDKGEPWQQARFINMISVMISDIISDVVSDMINRYRGGAKLHRPGNRSVYCHTAVREGENLETGTDALYARSSSGPLRSREGTPRLRSRKD